MAKKVVVLGAFDTKGGEHKYIIDIFFKKGLQVITVNTGVMGGTDLFKIDVDSDKVAAAGGTPVEQLKAANDRGEAIKTMADGAAKVIKELYDNQGFDGIIGMGGTAGTAVVTSAMRGLPFGLPKICVSTVASGDTSPYLGTSDIIMIPSLTDIAGINSLSRVFLTNAASALAGMVEAVVETGDEKPIIAASMFGNTTPCIDKCRQLLNDKGYEVLVFHATGAGGKTMEKLIKEGLIQGALDITTTEWADTLGGGVFDAGRERLDGPGMVGIPHLISPGCIDMCNFGAPDTIPVKYKDRLFYRWNPNVTLMRTTVEENAEMGKIFAEKANAAKGKVAFLIPLQGYSMLDSVNDKGEPQLFWDPAADKAFVDALKTNLKPGIEITEIDANVNDPAFSQKAVEMFLSMMQ